MQKCRIAFCGMEEGYMRKVAYYVKQRMGSRAKVCVHESMKEDFPGQVNLQKEIRSGYLCIFLVSKDQEQKIRNFYPELQKELVFVRLVKEQSDQGIYAYQSRQKIYQALGDALAEKGHGESDHPGRQKWILMMESIRHGKLLTTSLNLARQLSARAPVLLLNLTACSGFSKLIQNSGNKDLSDLIYALRKKEIIPPMSMVGNLDGYDYLPPAENPAILHEIRPEDMKNLIHYLGTYSPYAYVIVIMDRPLLGFEQVVDVAEAICCLRGKGWTEEAVYGEISSHLTGFGVEKDRVIQIFSGGKEPLKGLLQSISDTTDGGGGDLFGAGRTEFDPSKYLSADGYEPGTFGG